MPALKSNLTLAFAASFVVNAIGLAARVAHFFAIPEDEWVKMSRAMAIEFTVQLALLGSIILGLALWVLAELALRFRRSTAAFFAMLLLADIVFLTTVRPSFWGDLWRPTVLSLPILWELLWPAMSIIISGFLFWTIKARSAATAG